MITKPMLAVNMDDMEALKFPVFCTPKLDGIRAIMKNGRLVSRKFIDIPNEQIQEKFKGLPDNVDGELICVRDRVSGEGFNTTQSIVMREEKQDQKLIDTIHYYIFDYVKDDLKKGYMDRMEDLAKIKEIPGVKLLIPNQINDMDELVAYEKLCVGLGFEGIMIRTQNGPYKLGRSTEKEQYLLKMKRFEDSEAIILDFTEKEHNTNGATKDNTGHTKRSTKKEGMVGMDTLGAILVKGIKDQYKDIEFGIGSGFNDMIRQDIWDNRKKYKGAIVKYSYQPSGAKDKPRFPVFLGFRDKRDM